jgi:hypothetical protein
LFALSLFIGCKNTNEADNARYKAELEKHAKDYMISLKSVLVANMKEGGPLQAVNVCSDTAAQLTQEFSREMNVDVKRFSFKNRNVHNFPDPNEVEILKKFEDMYEKNELNGESYFIMKSENDERKTVVYAKPIFIEAPCLNCHGDENQVSSEVRKVLAEKYPSDKANGYQIGDFRGAISVTKDF